jgi:hypothetical protein
MRRLALFTVIVSGLGLGCADSQETKRGDTLVDSIRARTALPVISATRSPGRLDIVVVADSTAANPDVEFGMYAEKAKTVWPLLTAAPPETLVFVAERGEHDAKERSAFFFYRPR